MRMGSRTPDFMWTMAIPARISIAQPMFSGLVYCADCGKPMVLHRAHTMKPEQNHFTCRTYKKDGAEVCSAHYIREVALKEIVLETIRRATEFARSDPERFAAYIQQKQSTEVAKEIRGLERELSTICFYAERQQKRQTVQLHCLPNPRTRFKVPLSGVAEASLPF